MPEKTLRLEEIAQRRVSEELLKDVSRVVYSEHELYKPRVYVRRSSQLIINATTKIGKHILPGEWFEIF